MGLFDLLGGSPDRTSTNSDDGKKFYGYDDKDTGKTSWYDEDGRLDCELPTPSEKK